MKGIKMTSFVLTGEDMCILKKISDIFDVKIPFEYDDNVVIVDTLDISRTIKVEFKIDVVSNNTYENTFSVNLEKLKPIRLTHTYLWTVFKNNIILDNRDRISILRRWDIKKEMQGRVKFTPQVDFRCKRDDITHRLKEIGTIVAGFKISENRLKIIPEPKPDEVCDPEAAYYNVGRLKLAMEILKSGRENTFSDLRIECAIDGPVRFSADEPDMGIKMIVAPCFRAKKVTE